MEPRISQKSENCYFIPS